MTFRYQSIFSNANMETDGSRTEDLDKARDMNVFGPPILRSTAVLDRALFSKTFNLAAARVKDPRNITRYLKALERSRHLLKVDRVTPVVRDPEESLAAQGRKCLLLGLGVSASGHIYSVPLPIPTHIGR